MMNNYLSEEQINMVVGFVVFIIFFFIIPVMTASACGWFGLGIWATLFFTCASFMGSSLFWTFVLIIRSQK